MQCFTLDIIFIAAGNQYFTIDLYYEGKRVASRPFKEGITCHICPQNSSVSGVHYTYRVRCRYNWPVFLKIITGDTQYLTSLDYIWGAFWDFSYSCSIFVPWLGVFSPDSFLATGSYITSHGTVCPFLDWGKPFTECRHFKQKIVHRVPYIIIPQLNEVERGYTGIRLSARPSIGTTPLALSWVQFFSHRCQIWFLWIYTYVYGGLCNIRYPSEVDHHRHSREI